MTRIAVPMVAAGALLCYFTDAQAASTDQMPGVSLAGYTCAQYVAEATHPDDVQKLVRTMMLLSWVTGYAAAHSPANARADDDAFRLIGKYIAAECIAYPNELATLVTARGIDKLRGTAR